MYFLSRQILILALAVYGYCALMIAVLLRPYSWWVLVPLGFIALRSRRRKRMNRAAHGSAYWLEKQNAEQAGMLKGKGLCLGRLIDGSKAGLLTGLNSLLDRKIEAKQACLECFAGLRRKKTAPLVRMPPQTVHTAIFAPVGAGKSTGLIIPGILEAQESCVVLDLSGELMLAVADAKYRQGFEIRILDPYKVVTQ